MRLLLFISFQLIALSLVAQSQSKVHNLLAQLDTTDNISSKVEILCDLSLEYRNNDPKIAANYGKKAIIFAQKTQDKELLAKAYNNTGAGYFLLGDYETATIFYNGALKLREEIGDSAGLRASYINLANIYASQGNYKKALLKYKKSLHLAELNKDYVAASRALNNIGRVYYNLKQYDRSIFYYKRALPLKEEINDTNGIVISLISLGNIYNTKGYYAKALTYLNRALTLAEHNNNQHETIYILRGKAVAYQLAKNYNKAIEQGTQSLDLAKQLNQKIEIKHSADVLNKIYTETGDYEKAHFYLKLYNTYNDSISNERIKTQIALVQAKFETEKRAKENLKLIAEQELNVKELEQKGVIHYFFIGVLILVCAVALIIFAGSRRLKRINYVLLEKNEQITRSSLMLSSQKEALTNQSGQLQAQKEELERLNGIKDRLFSVIAHDLRGPLVSLKGLLQIMAKGKLPEEKEEHLFKSLVKGQQNVLWMLDNLFDWARAQMKGFEADKQPLDLNALVEENIRLLFPIANSKGVTLHNKLPEGELVNADKEMMKLVFRNLISNAIKFCSKGDLISISCAYSDGIYTVSVEDTGTGIAPEIIHRLFGEGNYSSRGTDNEKGSGLGLALCKDFIVQNGGTIWVESTLGEGSTFKFTLQGNGSVEAQFNNREHELLATKL